MLDFEMNREAVAPRDAATLLLVRDASAGGVEIFCVERSKKSRFMGGAVVFPGGKLDDADRDAGWIDASTPPRAPRTPIAPDDATLRALAVAACRETLEEAALLPLAGARLDHDALLALRAELAKKERSLLAIVRERGLRVDLAALHAFARWVTPTAESRRFDARFFIAAVDADARGLHDATETTSSFWARPADILSRFAAGEIQLAPPTHRTLEILATHANAADAIAATARACLEPICPRLVRHVDANGETMALALPGDPEHDVRERRVSGSSRFVLRGDRWLPAPPPETTPP
jgi:8-oxo-dGTP pyrophosphatase MutT (NUDIX family)